MLFHKTTLQLALCLTVGLSAAACSDDDGEGGGTTSTTSSSSASSGEGGATSSSSSASSGEGGANEGGANEGGANEGGANEGGANEGGANEGGSNEGGSNEGGSTPGDPACGADSATFADVQAILTASCAGCHGNAGPAAGGLDLRANAAHGGLVDGESTTCADRVLVVPGMPSQSYIINKLRNVDLCADGKPMPPPPAMALSEANIKKITDWICAGAPGT
ncbi:PE-PGRS family protein [Sorangium sp. So ce260]|uniref:PE-PGRS family protein n=1 Tax=Sorangium sp. So ce260 TaxID=3133291 RepID=UPI003F620D99